MNSKIILAVSLGCILGHPCAAWSANGDPDTTFGSSGRVTTSVGSGDEAANAVAVQADGKIVTAGLVVASGQQDFMVLRHNSDGTLDTTFNGTGKVVTPLAVSFDDVANAVVLDASGKILVGGYVFNSSNGSYDFALVRYNANGSLDTTLAGTGKVQTDFGGTWDVGRCMALQADGKILVGGYRLTAVGNNDFAVARYNADGSLDATFGTGGKVITAIGNAEDHAMSMAVLPDGRLVLAGRTHNGTNWDIALARYTSAGALDATFGSGGKVTTAIGSSHEEAWDVHAQGDGKILVAGETYTAGVPRPVVLRYQGDGTLDTTFNGTGRSLVSVSGAADSGYAYSVLLSTEGRIVVSGYVTRSSNSSNESYVGVWQFKADGTQDSGFQIPQPGLSQPPTSGHIKEESTAMALQSNGRIVVAGTSRSSAHPDADILLLRFMNSVSYGGLDSRFGVAGIAVNTLLSGSGDIKSLAVQPDGKIVVGGMVSSGTNREDFSLARYHPDGTVDVSFGTDGGVLTDFGAKDFDYCSSLALQPDGKIVSAGHAFSSGGNYNIAVARHHSNGTLDTGFGAGGKVITDIGTFSSDFCGGVAVQGDGKIVVACGYGPNGTGAYFAVLRYNTDGTLDSTFGIGGKSIADFGTGQDYVPYGLALRSDGRIVVIGRNLERFAVMCFQPNGALDPAFGDGGKVLTEVAFRFVIARCMAIQTDGKIVVGGEGYNDFAVVRYLENGALDTSFGSGGKVLIDYDGRVDSAHSLLVQPDGRIVLAGTSYIEGQYDTGLRFAVARLDGAGSLDGTFGTGGKVLTDIPAGTLDMAQAMGIQKNGQIVVAGSTYNYFGEPNQRNAHALVLYNNALAPEVSTGVASSVTSVSATLHSLVNANENAGGSSSLVTFEYGPTTAYGSSVPGAPGAVIGSSSVSSTTFLSGLLPGVTYHYRVKGTSAVGATPGQDRTFTTWTIQQAWRQTWFGTTDNSGTAADSFDADGDGLTNLMEFAISQSPLAPGPQRVSYDKDASFFHFRYSRSKSALSMLTFAVEWSDSLLSGSWSTSGVTEEILLDDGNTQEVTARIALDGRSSRFARLRVSQP